MGSRGKPTNAKNAYNFFTSIMHEEFKSLFPGKTVNFIDFQKKCAGKWKSLTPEDKLPFEKMASLDKLRFQEEVKIFPPPSTKDGKDGGKEKKKKKSKDPNEPKKPLSAFFLFSNQKRVEVKDANPQFSVGEIGRRLGEMWRNLSDESKRPFEEAAKRAKLRYGRAMEAFKEGRPFEEEAEEAISESKSVDNFENLDILLNDSIVQEESLSAEADEENTGLSPSEFDRLDGLLEDSMRADVEPIAPNSADPEDATPADPDDTEVLPPADPTPADPATADPATENPATENPAPTDIAPADLAPADPAPANPAPSDPAPSDSAPADPAPSDPDLSDPTPANPSQLVHAPSDPASSNLVPNKPPASDLTPDPSEPASKESVCPKESAPSAGAEEESIDAFEKLDECLDNDSDFDAFDQLDSLL